ncbi:MAG: rRNA pseudouridine synthase [Actinomycetota bacterium]|nr:rRNA pseudouridine synthase [Actinomycetota bacterium]
MSHSDSGERLQKVLAASGIASRRACEELMSAGRVEVDGEVVTRLGTRVDPDRSVIRVDGRRIPSASAQVYLVLNKPRGVVSTMSDPQGRPTLAEHVADRPERLFHVGRLDTETEGLILLTNDGEFAHRLAHPSYGVLKTYVAQVAGPVPGTLGRDLAAGVVLDDGPVRVDGFRVLERTGRRALVEVVLHEGRKHIVRRLLAHVGHPVQRLARTGIGPVRLGALRPGQHRELTVEELGTLLDAVEM